jgi:hypothetical protein
MIRSGYEAGKFSTADEKLTANAAVTSSDK